MRYLIGGALYAGTAISLFGLIGFLNPLSVGVSIGSAAWVMYEHRQLRQAATR